MLMQIISKENTNKVIATYGICNGGADRAAYVGHQYFYTAEKDAPRVEMINAPRDILPATGQLLENHHDKQNRTMGSQPRRHHDRVHEQGQGPGSCC